MRLLVCQILVLAGLLTSQAVAQSEDNPYTEVYSHTTYWQGSITAGGKPLPIRMTLNHYTVYLGDKPDWRAVGERWRGAYHYTASQKHLLLEGYTNVDRPALDDEEADQPHRILEFLGDQQTGAFLGTLTEQTYTGTWVHPEGTRKLPFRLTRVK